MYCFSTGVVLPYKVVCISMDSPDVRKTELLSEFDLQPRDLRVSALSSLYVRQSSIILKLQVTSTGTLPAGIALVTVCVL